jgi:hypothetical protein
MDFGESLSDSYHDAFHPGPVAHGHHRGAGL